MRFDQREINQQVGQGTIVRATLRVYVSGGWNEPLAVHRLRRFWSEASVTWRCAEDGTDATGCAARWAGGDYDPTPTVRLLSAGGAPGWLDLDVTGDVQQFLEGYAPNFGWLFRNPGTGRKVTTFPSREGDGFSARGPRLVLEFVPARTPPDVLEIAPDRWNFRRQASGTPFIPRGANYDHAFADSCPLLLEEYWHDHWDVIERDFAKMRALGFNSARIHLQLRQFLKSPGVPNDENLLTLDQLVRMARRQGIALDLTGLGQYRRELVPSWFSALDDDQMMDVEAAFWRLIAARYAGEPSIFVYDLQNEPVIIGGETDEVVSPPYGLCDPDGSGPAPATGLSWVHYHFRHTTARWTEWVQGRYPTEAALRAAWPDYPQPGESWRNPLGGGFWGCPGDPTLACTQPRARDVAQFKHELAQLWTARMVDAIHGGDTTHLVTMAVGLPFQDDQTVKGWAVTSFFTPYHLRSLIDFPSLHLYPENYHDGTDNLDVLEEALRGAHVGAPVVIEEMWPHQIGTGPRYDRFLARSLGSASGWYGFFWGQTPDEPATSFPDALNKAWLRRHLDFINRQVPGNRLTRVTPAAEVPVSITELTASPRARLALFDLSSAYSARDLFLDPILEP